MLPFLKDPNKMITTLLDRRSGNRSEIQPDIESKNNENHDQALEAIAGDLLSAIQSKSIHGIRDSLREAFLHLDSQPHEEGEHIEPESEESEEAE